MKKFLKRLFCNHNEKMFCADLGHGIKLPTGYRCNKCGKVWIL